MAADLAVEPGDEVSVALVDGSIVVTPESRIPTLDELLDTYDPATRHGETDWGPPVGKEVW
jgi:antitoxin component of MazEF toxin-antitoxin module